ncbi:MAG: two-component sensor histidine kinase, partial [Erysipelotrichaceae bacterium]|nr:two-component sensor histidine kinase [Erysipelotrichaceae bacterium]
MKKKINTRLILIALIAIFATAGAVTLVYHNLFRSSVRESLVLEADLLRNTRFFENEDLDSDIVGLSRDIGNLRITWIDKDGTVLYDNDEDTSTLQNHSDRTEIKEAFEKGYGEALRDSDTRGTNTYYYALLLENGTVLRLAREMRSIESLFLTVLPAVLMIILGISILCVILSRILTGQLLEPIHRLTEDIDDPEVTSEYSELAPFTDKIKSQHDELLATLRYRQDFTANITHELKTPLTSVLGYAEILENDDPEVSQRKRFAGEIRKNAKRLLNLINDIIRLSELDRPDNRVAFESFDLSEIAENCADSLSVSAKARGVEVRFHGEKAVMNGDPELLFELTENLLENAIRYNREGGYAEVDVRKENGKVLLKVKDNGIGIPEKDRSRVFE